MIALIAMLRALSFHRVLQFAIIATAFASGAWLGHRSGASKVQALRDHIAAQDATSAKARESWATQAALARGRYEAAEAEIKRLGASDAHRLKKALSAPSGASCPLSAVRVPVDVVRVLNDAASGAD